jgi:hypothetical protein
MIDADAELKTLEQEFPKSSRAWATDTDAALDRRILYIADAAARHLAQQYSEERDTTSLWPGRHFPRPTPGDDAKLKSVRRRERAMESSMPYEKLSATSMRALDRKRVSIPPGAEKVMEFLQNAEQHVWLDRIADIVKAGDVELAMYLLGQYRIKFVGE